MPSPLRAGLVLLILSSPALAQSVTLGFSGGGSNLTQIPFNQASCSDVFPCPKSGVIWNS